ncbi:hypothetical protein KCU65_g1729, partial [Aureobasidium melanogenum]
MISRRALHLKNGVTRSVIKPSSIISAVFTVPIRTGRRGVSFLEATASSSQPIQSDFESIATIQKALPNVFIAEGAELRLDTMNAQKEADLLAMQHILGLKDASDEAVKIKPKQLERLQRIKAADPVFVCIDLEAFEFAQDKITEVGVSILDSRHVLGTDPGPDGEEWLTKINTRHILIKEHKHLVNKRFVHGCPDQFNFGDSEVVPLKHIHKTLTQLFDNPSPDSIRASDRGSRNLIFVGHGLSNDTLYLSKLKFDPNAKGNIIHKVDTQKFVGTKKQQVGLSKLLAGLGVEPENLHNAGNDAAYTMQALLLMVVQHTNNPGAYVKAVADAKAKVDPAKQRYKDHKAAIRAKKLAQEKEVAANVALPQTLKLGHHDVESALPTTAYDSSLVARLPAGKERIEPSFRRLSLSSHHDRPAHLRSLSTDHSILEAPSRKRKSSDVEPVDGDDENKAWSSINKRLHNGQSDKTVVTPLTTSDAGSPLHITRHAGEAFESYSYAARVRAMASHKAAQTEIGDDQESLVSEAPSQTDTLDIRHFKVGNVGPRVYEADESVEPSQQPAHFQIRTTVTGKVKDDQRPARARALESHRAKFEAQRLREETRSLDSPSF